MYFWKIEKLKAQLIEKPLTDKEALPYLIATLILYALCMYIGLPTDYGLPFFFTLLLQLVSCIYGTIWLFKQNGGDNGKQFIHRYFTVGWVASIRFFVIAIPIFIVILTILTMLGLVHADAKTTGWNDVFTSLLMYSTFYWYLGKHISTIANQTKF
ncbi:MAG TPA: hypothetical protein PL131_08305 [Methylotenera sp.]|nr:hypothetical protein [Methylotenera sp.]HPH05860.1 hypothetical protein [Methylotenera sp.]HPN00642.1 hypothetical protein [Methylotenera sp.]